jgi:hypothetical protein
MAERSKLVSFVAGLWSGLSTISVVVELESIPFEAMLLLYSVIGVMLPAYWFVMGSDWRPWVRVPKAQFRKILPGLTAYGIGFLIGLALMFSRTLIVS